METNSLLFPGEVRLAAHNTAVIDFNGRRYEPDESTAYVDFHLAYEFPTGISVFGDTLMPEVIRSSARSIINKPLNIGHMVRSYDPENIRRDRIVGSIVDMELSQSGGPLHIRALASVFKAAEGVDRILGQHSSGRWTWGVSLEFVYDKTLSGFVVGVKDGDTRSAETPAALFDSGWNYHPAGSAPPGLVEMRDMAARKFTKAHREVAYAGDWKGRPVYFAMSGMATAGHFSGVGLVQNGAELPAHIGRFLASDDRIAGTMTEQVNRLNAALEIFSRNIDLGID